MRSFSARRLIRHATWLALCLTLGVCASCLTAAVPKGAKVGTPGEPSATEKNGRVDERLVAEWELRRHLDESGKEKAPDAQAKVMIEFTSDGKVVFRKADKSGGASRNRTGTYAPSGDALTITDDEGRTVRWDYEISGNTLTITWPQMNNKFIFERAVK